VSHPLHIVDVFAERPYAGNPLAVVLEAGDLTGQRMQEIAREMNYSETTFVTSGEQPDGGVPVRIFTTIAEIPFGGHPTLGTAWVLGRRVQKARPGVVRLNLGVGQVPVTFESAGEGSELAWLSAPPITLGPTCAAELVAPALGLSPDEIAKEGPVRQASAGFPTLMVPVRSLDALRRSRLDMEGFAPLAREGFMPFVYLFCTEPHDAENDLCARFYFDAGGVREDPATGSATACLGAYLLEHGIFGSSELSLRIEQGAEIDRPSLLLLRARESGGSREISVGGRVIPTAQGELL
jgi:trans-2,3-dihydro-3-hydroxyanthranilate isomerase